MTLRGPLTIAIITVLVVAIIAIATTTAQNHSSDATSSTTSTSTSKGNRRSTHHTTAEIRASGPIAHAAPHQEYELNQQCLAYGGQFHLQLPAKQNIYGFSLYGTPLYDIRSLFAYVEIGRKATVDEPDVSTNLLVAPGLMEQEQLNTIYKEQHSFKAYFLQFLSSEQYDSASQTSKVEPFGDHTLVITSNASRIIIECNRVTDWMRILMITLGLFLTVFSGVLASYDATMIVFSSLAGIAIGLVLPVLWFFNKQTKFFLVSASAGFFTYSTMFYWKWITSSPIALAYIFASAIGGIWFFGSSEKNKRLLNATLLLVGLCLLFIAHSAIEHKASLVGLGAILRILYSMGVLNAILVPISNHLFVNYRHWFPALRTGMTNSEYERQGKIATASALGSLRDYYSRAQNWRQSVAPESIKNIENFIATGDHAPRDYAALAKEK